MKIFLATAFLLIFSGAIGAQTLITASCKTQSNSKCSEQIIQRLTFEKGKPVSKETLLTFDANTSRYDRLRFRVLQNRYIVSQLGDVFDIQTKELFSAERGDYLGTFGNQIVLLQNKGGSNVKVAVFDLATKKYKKIEQPQLSFLIGLPSPSFLRSAEYRSSFNALTIHEREKNWNNAYYESLNGNFYVDCGKNCKDKQRILPRLWLDDNRLLTQRKNGHLIVIDVEKQKYTTVAKIPVSEKLEYYPFLFKDFEGNIHYRADKNYVVDIQTGKFTETQTVAIGNNFHVSITPGEKTFTFGDREIGKLPTVYYMTTKNYIAIEASDWNNLYYFPKELKVWNSELNDWTTLDIGFSPKIVGWIEN